MLDPITRTHRMIDRLQRSLGTLDHLCFAFPRVLPIGSSSYADPAVFVIGAIIRASTPSEETVKAHVSEEHPEPSTYMLIDGIAGLEVDVPSKSAKKLLKRRDCLVIERWGDTFVCRVPNRISDALGQKTIAVVGIPPDGHDWQTQVVAKMRDVCRTVSLKKILRSKGGVSQHTPCIGKVDACCAPHLPEER